MSKEEFKNENLVLTSSTLYYFTLHLKFSSLFYSSQLSDIFAYEVPKSAKLKSPWKEMQSGLEKSFSAPASTKFLSGGKSSSSLLTYNFHILNTQTRLYVFVSSPSSFYARLPHNFLNPIKLHSVTDLFFAANWLEREVAELNGIFFTNKKDLRNLMLQYGDSNAPFQKSFPTIGLKEMYYNPLKDTIIQAPISLQI